MASRDESTQRPTRKRLSDTAALAQGTSQYPTNVSVRKIDNGYLISKYEGSGGCHEYFTQERPLVEVDPDRHGTVGEEGFAGAKAEMEK